MLNNYNTTNSLKINACSGGIYKTCKESWFVRFNLKSSYSDKILRLNPTLNLSGNRCDETRIIILQMVICGEMEVIAELIKNEDYNKYFENKEVEKDE